MTDLKSGDASQAQKVLEVQNIAVMAQLLCKIQISL